MARKVRLSMEVSEEVALFLRTFAHENNVSVDELVERGVLAIERFRKQRAIGRNHLGFTADPRKLDAELLLFA